MQQTSTLLLNTIFITIPESLFMIILSLSILKIDNLLDILTWKNNLKWIIIASLPISIMLTITKFSPISTKHNMILSTMLIMILLIEYIVINNSFDVKSITIIKTAIYTAIGFSISIIIKFTYCNILLSLLARNFCSFDNNIFYSIILSIPVKVFHLCIISIILVRKNSKVKIQLFNSIIKNKFLIGSFLAIMLSRALIVNYISKLVGNNSILINLEIVDKLIIIVLVTTIPIVIITWIILFVNHFMCKNKLTQQNYENILNREGM